MENIKMVQRLINKMVEEKVNDDLVCEVEELLYQLMDEIEDKEDFIDQLNEYIDDLRYRQEVTRCIKFLKV